MESYVGSDVHSKTCSFVIQTADGTVVGQGEIPTTAAGFERLIDEQALPPGTPVARETGTVAFFVAHALTAVGLVPRVIDAHEVRLKAYRPRQKRDRRDAHEFCEGLRRGIYRTRVHAPPVLVAGDSSAAGVGPDEQRHALALPLAQHAASMTGRRVSRRVTRIASA